MLKSQQLRTIACDYIVQARAASMPKDKLFLTGLAKSYLLMAKNADWIDSTDKFLHAVRNGDSWPSPSADVAKH
jgi:hypothetical protein